MNKKFLLVSLLALAIMGVAYADSINDTINAFIRGFIFGNSQNWAISIDNTKIGLDEFSKGYKYYMDQIPEDQRKLMPDDATLKKQYLKDAMMQYIIVQKAMQENIFKDEESKYLLNAAMKQAIMQIYIKKYLPKNKDAFKPSQTEINKFYEANKEQLLKTGASADQIKQYIIQQLSAKNLQDWIADFMEKTKESFRIQRNDSVLKSGGFN